MWMTSRFLLVAVALPSVATFQLSGLRSIGASGPRNVRAMRARASKNGERDSPRADATDELVAAVARGADAPYSPPERERIAQLVGALERRAANASAGTGMLADPRLLGNWGVQYVLDASGSTRSPVGGPFRGTRLGRLLFRPTGLYQNLLEGATIVNLLRFRFLGIIPGSVTLRGRFARATDADYADARDSWVRRRARRAAAAARGGAAAEPEPDDDPLLAAWRRELVAESTVAARFERPVLALGRAAGALGPELSRAVVLLDTTFLDARVRLGRNREGTRFVCVRTADSAAEGWRLPLARASTAARDALRLALSMAIVLLIAKRTAFAAALRLPRAVWAHAPGGVVL